MRYFIVLARDGDNVVLENLRTHDNRVSGTLHQPSIIVFDDEHDDVGHKIIRILEADCKLSMFSDGKYPHVNDKGQVLYDITDRLEPFTNINRVQEGSIIEVD